VRFRPDGVAIVVLLTALVALGPISTDLYLPSLPAIRAQFGVNEGLTQLTLSLFMAGFAVSQLAYGPLSDRFGRRPVLLGGLGLYIGASLACFLAPSIGVLIAARAVQAMGACAGPVLGRAMVRDLVGPERAAVLLSYIGMAMALAPAVGPMLGGYLQVAFGWRAAFAALMGVATLLALTVALALPETNRHRNARATQPRVLLATYRELMADPVYRGYVATLALTFAGLFSFISGAAFVLIEAVGLSPDAFGLSFATIVLGYILGNFLSSRYTRRFGHDRMIAGGLGCVLAGGLPMAALALAGVQTAAAVVAPMALFMIGAGLILPNALAGAVGPYPTKAGSASALLGFTQMGGAAVVGALVGHLHDGTARPMALAIAVSGLAALVAFRRLRQARARMAVAV
jgi:DHA1 family bicyclomycin/chloramphenicol resistance-like MFS transporter